MTNRAAAARRKDKLNRLWSAALAYDRAHPQVADGALAAALAAISAPWIVLHTTGRPALWVCNYALILALVWRRRHPVAVLMVLSAVALAQWITAQPVPGDVALLVALFTIALERPLKVALAAAIVIEAGAIMASARWTLAASWDRSLIGLTGLVAAALLAGAVLRSRRAHLAELTERAGRLELERDQQAQIATAAERTRIAREMHDVIAHSLAVMVTMADGAAAKLERDPDTAAKAIDSISEVGRRALAETRRLLGVLRDQADDAERAPQPGLEGIDDLIHMLRSTGLDASVRYSGRIFDLAPGAELTLYRLVQEAATNTLKHAHNPTRFNLSLRFAEPRVTVEVTDDGTPPTATAGATDGHGLVGMRERVALYQGHVFAGPCPGHGWSIRATLEHAADAP